MNGIFQEMWLAFQASGMENIDELQLSGAIFSFFIPSFCDRLK